MKPITESGSKLLQQMKELEIKIGEEKKRMKIVEFLIKESGTLTNEFRKNICEIKSQRR